MTEEDEIKDALRRHFGQSQIGKVQDEFMCIRMLQTSMTKKAFRGSLQAFVELSEDLAARLIRTGHLKVGYGHRAAKCEGPDRTKCCWRCGKEGHWAVVGASPP